MYTLIIGNKNYSSWSLRPWLALKMAGVPFKEKKLILFSDEFFQQLQGVTPAALVPVLLDGDFAIWDSLAICEYAAEQHHGLGLWPADRRARARARSLTAQMHSGFAALRNALPMNIEANLAGMADITPAVQGDIDRVQAIWRDTRAQSGTHGPFLFGDFCIADAFYAPVVARFITYGVPAEGAVRAYMDAVWQTAAMQEWLREAQAEGVFVQEDEPYRTRR